MIIRGFMGLTLLSMNGIILLLVLLYTLYSSNRLWFRKVYIVSLRRLGLKKINNMI